MGFLKACGSPRQFFHLNVLSPPECLSLFNIIHCSTKCTSTGMYVHIRSMCVCMCAYVHIHMCIHLVCVCQYLFMYKIAPFHFC